MTVLEHTAHKVQRTGRRDWCKHCMNHTAAAVSDSISRRTGRTIQLGITVSLLLGPLIVISACAMTSVRSMVMMVTRSSQDKLFQKGSTRFILSARCSSSSCSCVKT